MEKLVIEGGKKLSGSVLISGSKNASLPILASTLLTESDCIIKNVPNVSDIGYLLKILQEFGAKTDFTNNIVKIRNQKITQTTASYDLVRKMRASICLLGPLLAKYGKANISLPGGCVIGSRPVDLHIKAMQKLGAKINIKGGNIIALAPQGLKGNKIKMKNEKGETSVLGTANAMMAGSLAQGMTEIHSAACEPEIIDLAHFLQKMGAKIEGEGTSCIKIEGVDSLQSVEHQVIPDRIEAGTFLIIGALLGKITLSPVEKNHLKALILCLEKIGYKINFEAKNHSVSISPISNPQGGNFFTGAFPALPTDIQAQLTTLLCLAKGKSKIEDTIFPERFMHCAELQRMGAKISVHQGLAEIQGVEKLKGAQLTASDLRASAALLIAGLVAEEKTTIHRLYHIDRGYENIDTKLAKIGASLKREKDTI